jgi:CRP-like cAMP-binding protein
VSLSLHLPGERLIEFPGLGRGEVLGEVPLFDGGCHSATVRAAEPVRLLWLSRAEFAALLARRHPTAFALKRRIAIIACGRLRVRLAAIAASLGGGGVPAPAVPDVAGLEQCGPPDSRYMCRLAAFRALDSLGLEGVLTAGRFALCPTGRTLVSEGAPAPACYVTINGAVEQVIVRGGRRTRIGLAGPGQAFGYESLIDGGSAPMTAITRERTLLLVLPCEAFQRLFDGETAGSHVFLDVIDRELMAALRQVQRPHARLATMPVSRPAGAAGRPAHR